MCVHALHTVHALPDLRIAGGRLGDGFYHALLFATADLGLIVCARSKQTFEVSDDKSSTCEDLYRVNKRITTQVAASEGGSV